MNILITSCSKKVLLVKSIKTYLNNMGGLLYTTDINVNSPALYFSDDYFADDGVHYNEDGADFIATQYYSVLVDLLQ